ncbi:MAG: helix-turn-helix domain-containing protein [Nocardioides sp.]
MVQVADEIASGGQKLTVPAQAFAESPTVTTITQLRSAAQCEVFCDDEAATRSVRRVLTSADAAELRTLVSGEGLLQDRVVCLDSSLADHVDPKATVNRLAQAGASAVVVSDVARRKKWLAAARGAGLALVLAPDERVTHRLVNELLDTVVQHHERMLQREDEVHQVFVRSVLAGGSLQELCASVVPFVGGPVVVTTTDGRVLATAGDEEQVERVLALDCFDRTGRLVVEEEPVGLRPPVGARAQRGLVRIVAGNLNHGLLGAFSDRVLTAADILLLERAATVAALAITKEQAVSAVESKYRAEFLRDALAGRAGNAAEAIAHATALGWDIDRPMVIVVAEIDDDDDDDTRDADEMRGLQDRFARAWTRAVSVRDPKAPVAGFSHEVVVLLPADPAAEPAAIMQPVRGLVKTVSGDGGGGRRAFSTGVSRVFTSVTELPEAYLTALSAVAAGRRVHGDGSVNHFDELGIYRLLALVPDSAELRTFVNEALGELATDANPLNADLRQTLQVLLDTNLNVAETARTLFFHYNTLRYRIVKLEQMLGPFTTDPELRLTLALALRIHQMRGVKRA